MARILTEQQFSERIKSILEYTQAMAPTQLQEAEPTQEDPAAMGGSMGDAMGGDPNMMGGMEDPSAQSPMGNAPTPQEDPAAMGGDPNMMGGGVEGLNPQADASAPTEDGVDDVEDMEDDDEVIDVDELTGYQKRTAKGVGQVSDEIKALKDLIIKFQEKVDANNQGLESLQREIEKRVPSQEEKLSLRKKQSSPFNQGIENEAPENYSVEDDNNGEGEAKYQITKSDIDGIDNWNEIARSFDDMAELNSLRNIFDF